MNQMARLAAPRGDRHFFSTSDDTTMMKQILATHAPDGRDIEVKPILQIVEDIFHRAAPTIPGTDNEANSLEALDEKTLHPEFREMLELLSYTITKISSEILCKCTGGGDAHATTVAIFNIVTSYQWDAKIVLALAAFSVNYGDFWLVAQLYSINPLAKGIGVLRQMPDILERADSLKPKYEAISKLIKAMLDVTRSIVEFQDLPSQYITPDTPEMLKATALIPTAVYWTIRSIVACASQITGLISLGHEYIASTTESWELSSLAHKVNNIHSLITENLTRCYQMINQKKFEEAYQALCRLFETAHIDNSKILKALIYAKDDKLPLYEGYSKQLVSIDVLRRKNVLLLISDIDIPQTDLAILEQMYQESRQNPTREESQYEFLWLPVVDRSLPWTEEMQIQFEGLKNSMPWYSLSHPTLLDPAVIKYIKEEWCFNKKPLLVVLNPQGRVVNKNAIHMMWIWGSLAFPFTSAREEELWKEESWRIELLADSVEPMLFQWIQEGAYICLYGGDNIDWIRQFTTTAQGVAGAAGITLEMLYVGKSNPKVKLRKNSEIILQEKLSHVLTDLTLMWFFWVRLESMWHSKVQHGKSVETDPIMQEIVTMLSFDGSDQGWAVFCRGPSQMVRAKDDTILTCLKDYEQWKVRIEEIGFVPALDEYLHKLHTPHHCNRLILPGTTGRIPEKVVCAECNRPMEKFLMYRCCTD